jgi:hypothetical protein
MQSIIACRSSDVEYIYFPFVTVWWTVCWYSLGVQHKL